MIGIDLRGKSAIVTGAAKGIGRGVSEAFAANGAAVTMVDLDGDALSKAAASIKAAGGIAIGVRADVRSDGEVLAAVEAAVGHFGGVDILVNNAGVVRYGRVEEMSEADWDLQLDTNLKAHYLTMRHAIPKMRMRGGGAIVNLASVQAFASQQAVAAYSASKGAVVALTRTIALDHAVDGIRANCIAPGSIDTPMLRSNADLFASGGDPADLIASWGACHPIGRVGTPEDIANLVVFLSSDLAAFITGTCVVIDGGLLAKLGV
jgi:NAD(P)-dependent dehydrogenase (short-subunit alcohol dehydrogenase family)